MTQESLSTLILLIDGLAEQNKFGILDWWVRNLKNVPEQEEKYFTGVLRSCYPFREELPHYAQGVQDVAEILLDRGLNPRIVLMGLMEEE